MGSIITLIFQKMDISERINLLKHLFLNYGMLIIYFSALVTLFFIYSIYVQTLVAKFFDTVAPLIKQS